MITRRLHLCFDCEPSALLTRRRSSLLVSTRHPNNKFETDLQVIDLQFASFTTRPDSYFDLV